MVSDVPSGESRSDAPAPAAAAHDAPPAGDPRVDGARADDPLASLERWPMHMALAVIGGKWKLILVCRIMDGIVRFNELQRSIPSISEKMLAQQLRELERDGIVTRTVHAEVPPRVEYALTPLGRALQPVADAVYGWGAAYVAARRAARDE